MNASPSRTAATISRQGTQRLVNICALKSTSCRPASIGGAARRRGLPVTICSWTVCVCVCVWNQIYLNSCTQPEWAIAAAGFIRLWTPLKICPQTTLPHKYMRGLAVKVRQPFSFSPTPSPTWTVRPGSPRSKYCGKPWPISAGGNTQGLVGDERATKAVLPFLRKMIPRRGRGRVGRGG